MHSTVMPTTVCANFVTLQHIKKNLGLKIWEYVRGPSPAQMLWVAYERLPSQAGYHQLLHLPWQPQNIPEP